MKKWIASKATDKTWLNNFQYYSFFELGKKYHNVLEMYETQNLLFALVLIKIEKNKFEVAQF